MELKLKHKPTSDYSDNPNLENSRSRRPTKPLTRSFRPGSKDIHPFDISSAFDGDQRLMKTIVDVKIQELHDKMKNFFTQERKTHFEQIAPEMQEISKTITQLKEELNRPKSMSQIEKEKHLLLKRKVALLREIEETNRKVKENKSRFCQINFQAEQLDRQLKNGHATIAKYKKKLESENRNSIQMSLKKNVNSQTSKIFYQESQNMQKILNESVLEENASCSPKDGQRSIPQMAEENTSRLTDHVHITEVIEQKNVSKTNLNNKQNTKTKQGQKVKHKKIPCTGEIRNLMHGLSTTENQQLNRSHSLRSSMITKMKKNLEHIVQNNQILTSKKSTISGSPSDSYLKLAKMHIPLQNHHKSTKSGLKSSLDMNSDLKKYEDQVNKQKWSKIDELFASLDSSGSKSTIFPKTNSNQSANPLKNQALISELQEMLMKELRKGRSESCKEKGQHEGIKDKTQQMRIDIKRIFKNFSADEFFESVINKKHIKKQLAMIIEDSLS